MGPKPHLMNIWAICGIIQAPSQETIGLLAGTFNPLGLVHDLDWPCIAIIKQIVVKFYVNGEKINKVISNIYVKNGRLKFTTLGPSHNLSPTNTSKKT